MHHVLSNETLHSSLIPAVLRELINNLLSGFEKAITRPLASFNGHDGKISFYRTLQEVIMFEIYSVRTSADMADQINLAERVKVVRLYSLIPPGRENVVFLLMSHELSTNVQFLPFLHSPHRVNF